jgi:DNA ligase (NAD+)
MQMSIDDYMQIDGVGEKVAHAVYEYLQTEDNRQEIARLLERGVKPHSKEAVSYHGHAFAGKIFVLTGTLHSYTRSNAATLIKERGGKVSETVSKKTNFLLAGESAGSKLEKAQQLGITLLSEEQFRQML